MHIQKNGPNIDKQKIKTTQIEEEEKKNSTFMQL